MPVRLKAFVAACLLAVSTCAISDAQDEPTTAPMRFVSFDQVQMDDQIWQPRIRLLVNNTLPHAFKNTEVAQRRLRLCAEWLESGGQSEKPEPHRFNTSDLYKVMEGAALMIQSEPNDDIEAMMDHIIHIIARAQASDGYLYVPHITGSIYKNEMGDRPYSFLIHSHELYNVGHLYEAAVAYAQATGKTKLLEVAEKNAAHVQRAIFDGDPNYNDGKPIMQAPGHQEIEIGLLKLYAYTGKELYLQMAKRFLDIRGVTFVPDGDGVNSATYAQQHLPVAKQKSATGHAVRATYQYAAMAEVDSLRNSDDYSEALDHIWHDIVDRKMHITGGLGAVHGIEGFGPDYVLPNKDTYLETCAAVGNVFFNMRMFLKYRDAKYVDVAEIALLNNCLAGMGEDGTTFFYPNPLEADQRHQPRSGWFGTACCPSNIARLIPQVSGYMYASDNQSVDCVLYGSNSTTISIDNTHVQLRQTTDYPWSGSIKIDVNPKSTIAFPLRLRIPTWAGSQLVPGELYSFANAAPKWEVKVNGQAIQTEAVEGFVTLERQWNAGDQVQLILPMPVRKNRCIDEVEANRGRFCFSRGPIVYCAEGIDNEGAVQRFFVPDFRSEHVKEVATDKGWPELVVPAKERKLEAAATDRELRLLPYFAWSNRDRSSMQVWFPESEALATPDLTSPDNLRFAAVKASHTFAQDNVDAVRMKHTPKSSADTSIPRWTSWPEKGKEQWVEVQLERPMQIRSVGVYFYDDQGGVQVPKSWVVQLPDGENWNTMPIYNTDQYSVLPDNYNTIHPATTTVTDRLRLQLVPQHDQTTVGILSLDIDIASPK
ncbi:glycoside hydrolase family 127 protein [Stieleria sp. JC731]|uniref:glycoside hydrolase family 127 protein n=1 Tax=Pirellulaceae TaxID=2691357 RepID=UPI001E5FD6D1|nr:beta-L-arabinofuranosidase domain-containing protein [Stieleria sp. JC731]MCC9603131.1 glycoside hydrolase family 127 protein [Stieleria sp. JC731]